LRNGEAKRLGGLEVDNKLILGWRLHRQVPWLLVLEDAIDVLRRAPEMAHTIRSVRYQAAASDEDTVRVDRGQPVLGCKLDDQLAMDGHRRARGRDQGSVR